MNGRVHRLRGLRGLDPLEDHRVAGHRGSHEAGLSRERRCASLPDHPHALAEVLLEPREVVVVVDLVVGLGAEDPQDPVDDPVAPRVGIVAGEPHRLEIPLAELGLEREQGRRGVHLLARGRGSELPSLREREKAARRLVPEPTRPEVHSDPEAVVLVGEQVHVVVAGTDGTELLGGQVVKLALGSERRLSNRVEHRMVGNRLLVRAAHPEADPLDDLVHDPRDGHVAELEPCPHRLVSAGDVIADARRRDVIAIRNPSADGLGVPGVVVGAQDARAPDI